MTKLLAIQSDPKTVKGEAYGYITAVMYLAPSDRSGVQLCPFAKQAGCEATCLNTAGRGAFHSVQEARLRRSRLLNKAPHIFYAQLKAEIEAFQLKADRLNLTPVVRLNGTSDIVWEKTDVFGATIFEAFPNLQFYDYTKIAKRLGRKLPSNYHLSLSYSEADAKYAKSCWKAFYERQASLIMVVRREAEKNGAIRDLKAVGYNVVDGDKHDLRFLDEPNSLVLLKAKGRAKNETNGFVLSYNDIRRIIDAAETGEVA
jgi:hypothetical protein